MDEDELERKAVEELLIEARRGRERAEKVGPDGWRKPSMKVNKRFLTVALSSSVSSNQKIRLSKDLPNYQKIQKKEIDNLLKKTPQVQNDTEMNDKLPHAKKRKIGE